MSATRSGNGNGRVTSTNGTAADYVPDLVITPRSSLYKAATPRLDPFTEIGTSGLRQFGGYVLEEWLAQLSGRKAAWVWREMLDNDPVVGAVMFAIRWLAHAIEWRVDGGDSRAAELVETAMHDMSHTWGDLISECISFLPYGWAFHEPVYKRRNGPQPERPPLLDDNGADTQENNQHKASSKYTDGLIGWRKIPVRAQETLLRWGFDGYSGLSYMEQIDWHGGDHKIPIQKGLLFRTQTTRGNPEGRSMLRNAFTSYFALKNIRQVEAIGIERDLAGIPVATPPDGVDLFSPGQSQLLQKVQQLVTQIRRDEYEGVVLPSAGWKLELLSTAGSRQFDTDKVVRRYRADIALSMLADFVLIGQDSVGSFAMVEVKSDMFGVALDGILDLVCEVFNQYAIPRLLRLNGMNGTDAPELKHGSARKIDLDRVGSFLQAISLAGAPIPWSMELLKALFADAGLPADFEDHEPLDGLPGLPDKPAPAPGGPKAEEDLEGERVAAEQQRAAEQVEKAETRKVRQGTVVDLAPHLQARHRILSGQADQEIEAALRHLGEQAATAYQSVAEKASRGATHRLVAKVLKTLNLQAWIETVLRPLLRNHAARVTADTQRLIQAEIGLEVGIADDAAQRIADSAGRTLGMRDIEPQVRQALLLAIRQGLEAGENPVKTAQRIRDQVPAGRFVNAGPKYRAQLIARNETANLQRRAALAAYQSNPHVTHVELRDGIYGPPRSDPDCISRDGEIVPIDDAAGVLPEHPLCTLSLMPVIEPASLPDRELALAKAEPAHVHVPVKVDVHVPAQQGDVYVHVPDQPAPIVNVPQGPAPVVKVDVEVPEQPAPHVTVEAAAAPNVTVEAPEVTVRPEITVQAPAPTSRRKIVTRSKDGHITGIEEVD